MRSFIQKIFKQERDIVTYAFKDHYKCCAIARLDQRKMQSQSKAVVRNPEEDGGA